MQVLKVGAAAGDDLGCRRVRVQGRRDAGERARRCWAAGKER